MEVFIASDHAGFSLKSFLINNISHHKLLDLGTDSEQPPVDYPDFAQKLALKVLERQTKGILICGSGVGANIVANKFKGIKASVCHDTYSAKQGVEHDNMNVLVLGKRIIGEALALEIVNNFLAAKFSQEERHQTRVQKIAILEEKNFI